VQINYLGWLPNYEHLRKSQKGGSVARMYWSDHIHIQISVLRFMFFDTICQSRACIDFCSGARRWSGRVPKVSAQGGISLNRTTDHRPRL
jgi:hypothetical protein